MVMKLVPFVCPSCGGQIQVPPDRKTCFCTYCGTQIALDDGTQTINIHHFDEAELRRIELEAEETKRLDEAQERYEAQRKVWRIAIFAWLVVITVLMVVSTILDEVTGGSEALDILAGCILIFGPIALLVLRPRKPKRRGRG